MRRFTVVGVMVLGLSMGVPDVYDNRTGEGNVWTANDLCTDNLEGAT